MPICIAGVPFSGVATVARILDGLGVDVGPQEELLGDGGSGDFWSNRRFARLNEAILEAVGAAWDVPPPGGVGRWTEQPQLQPLRKRAQDVADSLALTEPWGWADPRNALTLPFWRSVYPDMDVVVCIRHPLQVARSLEADGSTSFSEGLALWGSYYSAAVASEVGVVTNSNRLVEEPEAEVDRLVEAVGLSPSRAEIKRAVATLAASDGGEMPSDSVALPPEIDDLYRTLLEAASSSRSAGRPAATRSTTAGRGELTSSDLGDVVAAQRIELENLRLELIRKRGYLEALQAQLDSQIGFVLLLPLFASAILGGVAVNRGLARAALLGVGAFVLLVAGGAALLLADRPLVLVARVSQRLRNAVVRTRPPLTDLDAAAWDDLGLGEGPGRSSNRTCRSRRSSSTSSARSAPSRRTRASSPPATRC